MANQTRAPRTRRTEETREHEQRETLWKPASHLPTPESRDGVSFRWVRTTMGGESDNNNVSKAFREGYVPVKRDEHPELSAMTDNASRFPENIEIGGLLLCQISSATAAQRSAYYEARGQAQIDAADSDFLNQSSATMPIGRGDIDRRST